MFIYSLSNLCNLIKTPLNLLEKSNVEPPSFLACSAGVFFEHEICPRKCHVETSRREEEMGRVKGSGEGAGREKRVFFLPSPSPLSFFRPRTYRKGYYFYSPQSSTYCHKIKDGGYNNITNTNKVSPTQNTPALQATSFPLF